MGKKLFRKFMCVLLVAVLALNPLDTKAIASDYAPTYTVTTEAAPALGGLGVRDAPQNFSGSVIIPPNPRKKGEALTGFSLDV